MQALLRSSDISLAGVDCAPITSARPILHTTIVYIVRHAEKELDGSDDPHLTSQGGQRAAKLCDLLKGRAISSVYTTRTTRSRETAAPIASAIGIEPTPYASQNPEALATAINARHAGESVLVIAHATTLTPIVHALGGPRDPNPPKSDYQRLYIVSRFGEHTVRTIRRRF